MDFVIVFFRDILSGPVYAVVSIISFIFICSCIGYLAEQYYNKKDAASNFEKEHIAVESTDDQVSKIRDNSSLDGNVDRSSAKSFNAALGGVAVDINKVGVVDNLGLSNLQPTVVETPQEIARPVGGSEDINAGGAVALSSLDSSNNTSIVPPTVNTSNPVNPSVPTSNLTPNIGTPISDNPQVVFQSNSS